MWRYPSFVVPRISNWKNATINNEDHCNSAWIAFLAWAFFFGSKPMGILNGCTEVMWSEVLFWCSSDDFQIRVGISSLVSSCSFGFLNNQLSDGRQTFRITRVQWEDHGKLRYGLKRRMNTIFLGAWDFLKMTESCLRLYFHTNYGGYFYVVLFAFLHFFFLICEHRNCVQITVNMVPKNYSYSIFWFRPWWTTKMPSPVPPQFHLQRLFTWHSLFAPYTIIVQFTNNVKRDSGRNWRHNSRAQLCQGPCRDWRLSSNFLWHGRVEGALRVSLGIKQKKYITPVTLFSATQSLIMPSKSWPCRGGHGIWGISEGVGEEEQITKRFPEATFVTIVYNRKKKQHKKSRINLRPLKVKMYYRSMGIDTILDATTGGFQIQKDVWGLRFEQYCCL